MSVPVQMKFSKDELAIMGWVHGRAGEFGGRHAFPADQMRQELGLSAGRYRRATSLLVELSLAVVKQGRPAPAAPPNATAAETVTLTAAGVMAYRHAGGPDEWDVVPEESAEEDRPAA